MAATRASRSKRKVRPTRRVNQREEEFPQRRRRRRLVRTRSVNTAAPRKGKVVLELPCTVRSFSEAAGISSGQVIMALFNLGQTLTINQQIDEEYGELLAGELGVELELKQQT